MCSCKAAALRTRPATHCEGASLGRVLHRSALQRTAGDEGPVGDLSSESIFAHFQGLLTSVQLAATTWSAQIWISCWILPHFDVRTISVAWKLKKLSNIFWQKIFFLLNPLSKGVAPLCNPRHTKTGKAKDRQITIKWSSLFLQYYIIRVEINLQCTSQYVT